MGLTVLLAILVAAPPAFAAGSPVASATAVVPGPTYDNHLMACCRGGLSLDWTQPFSDGGLPITGYEITLRTQNVEEPMTRTVGPDVRRTVFTDLGDGTIHTATIAARNAVGLGAVATLMPRRTWTTPTAPTSVAAVAGRSEVKVTWASTSWPVTSYVVTAHPTNQAVTVSDPVKSVTFSALGTADVEHTFTVVARNVVGDSAPSKPSAPVRLVQVPQKPVVTATLGSRNTAVLTWAAPLGYDDITGYEVCRRRADGSLIECVLVGEREARFPDVPAARTESYTVRAVAWPGDGPVSDPVRLTTPTNDGTTQHVIGPRRVLDTRVGLGAARGPVGANASVTLTLPGVPLTATSATFNLTAVGPTRPTWVTAHAAGEPRPTAAHLNLVAGETRAAFVTVPVTKGRVTLVNAAGQVHLLADLAGYTDGRSGLGFVPQDLPLRALDTRTGVGAPRGAVGPGGEVVLTVPRGHGVPDAVLLNVTGVGATTSTYITAYASGSARPVASTINLGAGRTMANLVLVPVGADGRVRLHNNAGSVNLLADVVGEYHRDRGMSFFPVGPLRWLDTRTGVGEQGGPVSASHSARMPIFAQPERMEAVLYRASVVAPTRAGFLSASMYPHWSMTTSILNFTAGEVAGNMSVTGTGPSLDSVYFGVPEGLQTHVVTDVAGFFVR
ncbi:fibronectin type III domain-containing protein [Knoellia sp. CPCC 206450]|uniref:fibronectin type III domain-containing protein n=1 Tax=Knoellia tibetensis TaxID=3404798 RepID=UPI003B4385DB